MSTLQIVIFFSLVGGIFSLIGGLLLTINKSITQKLLKYVTPFAAGALLAAAFIDVLPESAHEGDIEQALRWALAGIIVFFLLERSISWLHHHHGDDEPKRKTTAPLIIIGDTVHNLLDGIAIAAAFLIDVPTGIVTTLAVAAHEIPQEIGDFGLLLSKGMSREKVIIVNILSALAATVAAVAFFLLGSTYELPLDIALGLVAGFFIYIAVSDIIPDIHKSEGSRLLGPQTIMLIVGALVVGLATTTLHQYIDTGSEPHSHRETEHGHEH